MKTLTILKNAVKSLEALQMHTCTESNALINCTDWNMLDKMVDNLKFVKGEYENRPTASPNGKLKRRY